MSFAYLIFVIFFTRTHFKSWQFYTRKVRKFITVFFFFFWNFFYTQPKFLHARRSRRSWQISGMEFCSNVSFSPRPRKLVHIKIFENWKFAPHIGWAVAFSYSKENASQKSDRNQILKKWTVFVCGSSQNNEPNKIPHI